MVDDKLFPNEQHDAHDVALFFNAANGKFDEIKKAFSENPKLEIDEALGAAADNGHDEIVRFLIEHHKRQTGFFERLLAPKKRRGDEAMFSRALVLSSANGHANIVSLLIPLSDATRDGSAALRFAAKNGHVETVKLLMPVSNPKDYESEALCMAAEQGHHEIVRLLAPVSDINPEALRWAAIHRHVEATKSLIPISDVKHVIERFVAAADAESARWLESIIQAETLNTKFNTDTRKTRRTAP